MRKQESGKDLMFQGEKGKEEEGILRFTYFLSNPSRSDRKDLERRSGELIFQIGDLERRTDKHHIDISI
ncbi:hypothetical protein HanHA300_Chr13g0475221 [Helianthus annuus]|nr:hypothetical protein HanHA300_Chr13g0475221 [Helianthus annuus]KAJ0497059.1 hypothetical protein HanHA89_Chr13g0507141 [Helianthus annuus]KAJ0663089.1 hypothetical protein HanLR1_Chr13g0477331 [Helianthus annuus]KAJ0670584.1 hypothetical protein HanOQP8_Chr13g0476131 [Helianthus annuus]